MNKQIKTTLLHYLKLSMLSCIVSSAYADNIPENLSNWVPGISTKNVQSNATFSIGVLTESGENFGSLFKLQQEINVLGDIRVAPEHVGKNGQVYIVAQYNNAWFMKAPGGWIPWNLQVGSLIANSPSHPLLSVESPVIESKLVNLLGNFEVFLGYQVDDDLNYNKTPLKFKVDVSKDAPDLAIKSFKTALSTLKPSDKAKLLVVINNLGNVLAPDTQLYYYQRAGNSNEENSLNEGDKQECTQSLYRLPAGHLNDKYCQVDMPDKAGDYYYGVCVKTVEGESNLTNNCSSAIKLSVKEPDPVADLIAQAALTGLSDQTKVSTDANFNNVVAGGGSGSGAISYSSSDASIATVNSSTGEVDLLEAGITTITATKAADSTYSAQTATYTLTVNPVTPTSVTITPKNSKLEVSWIDSNAGVAGGYNVYVSSSSSQATPLLTVPMISGTKADITSLLNSETYYVVVRKEVNSRESAASTEVSSSPNGTMGMNDTGITLTGSAANCTSATPPEDCSTGRDAKASAGTLDKLGGGQAGFDFTKLASNGNVLVDQTVAWGSSGGDEWSCVKDNVTGLVWEVKTDSGVSDTINNIHHKDNTYQWGGTTAIGKGAVPEFGVYNDDWSGLVADSNTASLCGFNTGWRVPTKSELASITHKGIVGDLAVDKDYFPNSEDAAYWTSSPAASDLLNAWLIAFGNDIDGTGDGSEAHGLRSGATTYRVRLVH